MKNPLRLLALLSLAAAVSAAESPVRRDVPYAGTTDPEQTLDVYAGPSGSGHPVMIWIHGGGWAGGDKADPTDTPALKAEMCRGRGCLLVSVNYRLLDGRNIPSGSHAAANIGEIESDLAKAARWVHLHAAEFGGDPDFFFVMGHSAGAQLAALLCTDERYLQAEGLSLGLVKGCIPVDGDTYHPSLQIDMSTPRRATGYRLKFPDGRLQRHYSSVLQVSPGKGIPPFLLLHVADFPETGTRIQAEVLAQTLRNAGIPARTFAAPGQTHLTLDADLGRPDDPATKVLAVFLDEQIWRNDYSHWSRSAKVPPPAPRE
jgi:acetyl esterase/lipase